MKKLQQLLCLLLCLVFCLALLPAAALAEDADEDAGAIALVEDPAGEGTIAPATEPETLPAPGDEPNAGDVAINVTNFPDTNFREDVKQYDTDSNGYLSPAELAAVTSMNCVNKKIADLKGVEHFTALTELYCGYNQLTSLDLSKNVALTMLNCDANQLVSLDVSKNAVLKTLQCGRNQLTSLDVSANTALTWLSCDSNYLTSLDLSAVPALKGVVENGTRDTSDSAYDWYYSSWGTLYVDKTVTIITDPTGLGIAINPANFPDANFREFVKQYDKDSNGYLSTAELAEVTTMDCGSKSIADLTGIEHFTALTKLSCYDNRLTSLDVSQNTALTYLSCGGNRLTSLDVSNNTALTGLFCYDNQLTSLDLSGNTALTRLSCRNNQLASLDVSKNTALTVLYCGDNQLTSLDVSKNTALTELWCDQNQLTSLDLSKNVALTWLICYDNQLTSLDLSKNVALTDLVCCDNQLTELDVSHNTALTYLDCEGNQLTFLDLSAVPALKDAVENGTKNTSNSEYDKYSSSRGMLYVDKTVMLVTGGNPFTDVPEGKYYYVPVLWAYYHDPQITTGTTATTFGPDDTCTRSQVVTFLWRADGKPEPMSSECPFTDIKTNAFYYKAVLWAVENGITTGTTATTFGPDDTCTRSQVVTFLWRADGKPEPMSSECPFTDIKTNAFYYKAVLWAVENGITTGTTATTFGPDDTCTRGQIVTFLYRYVEG